MPSTFSLTHTRRFDVCKLDLKVFTTTHGMSNHNSSLEALHKNLGNYVCATYHVQTLTSYCLCVTTGAIFEQSQGWQLNKHQRQQIRINADKFKIEQFRIRQRYLEVLKQIWECLKGLP